MLLYRYQDELGREEVIESNLTESMIECINNEIVLRSITDQSSLFQVIITNIINIINIFSLISYIQWLRGTFYYVRVHKQPSHYHIAFNPSVNAHQHHVENNKENENYNQTELHSFINTQLQTLLSQYIHQLHCHRIFLH